MAELCAIRLHMETTLNRPAEESISPPASFRRYALQDCLYMGGFLNNGPDQFIPATDKGWRIVTPGTVSIEATKITANCDIETSGDVKAGSVSLKQHIHGGVQSGSSNTGPAQ